MRFSSVVAVLAAALAPAAAFTANRRGQSVMADPPVSVPGESPLEFCPGAHDDDIATIERVDLNPNPPKAGVNLTVTAVGVVHEQIEEGAYVLLQVKYGVIRLITTKADLCEQMQNVDMKCPIEKGLLSIEKIIELPNQIPPGKYTVFADVYTWDEKPITCLQATVVFPRGGGSASFFPGIEL